MNVSMIDGAKVQQFFLTANFFRVFLFLISP